MTTHTLRRWGAVLFAGGLCLTLSYVFYPSNAHSSLIRPAAALGLVGIAMLLPGLVAYQRGQAARATVNGWIATTMLCIGLGLLEIPHLILGTFSPSSLYDLDAYHASLWGQLEFPAVIFVAVGTIVLAVATRRSGFYPGLAFWALVANVAFAAADSFVGPLADALQAPAPNYACTALLGLAMIRLAQARGRSQAGAAESLDRPDSEISVTR